MPGGKVWAGGQGGPMKHPTPKTVDISVDWHKLGSDKSTRIIPNFSYHKMSGGNAERSWTPRAWQLHLSSSFVITIAYTHGEENVEHRHADLHPGVELDVGRFGASWLSLVYRRSEVILLASDTRMVGMLKRKSLPWLLLLRPERSD